MTFSLMTGLVSGMLTNFKKIIIWSNFIDFKQKFLSSFPPLPPSGYFFNLKAKGMFCTYPTEDFFVKLISCIPWTVLGNKIIWIFLAETCKIGLKDCSGPDPVLLGFSDWYAWYWGAKRPASPHRADSSSEPLSKQPLCRPPPRRASLSCRGRAGCQKPNPTWKHKYY